MIALSDVLRWLRGASPGKRPAWQESKTRQRCPLCGQAFATDEAATCASCPLLRRCGLVMCPRCGYEFPPE